LRDRAAPPFAALVDAVRRLVGCAHPADLRAHGESCAACGAVGLDWPQASRWLPASSAIVLAELLARLDSYKTPASREGLRAAGGAAGFVEQTGAPPDPNEEGWPGVSVEPGLRAAAAAIGVGLAYDEAPAVYCFVRGRGDTERSALDAGVDPDDLAAALAARGLDVELVRDPVQRQAWHVRERKTGAWFIREAGSGAVYRVLPVTRGAR
jgi:hypothetical protein